VACKTLYSNVYKLQRLHAPLFCGLIFFPFLKSVIMPDMKIGVMGARGSFSEQVGELYAPDGEIIPLVSAENVLRELHEGSIERGIFPIENSNGGIVLEAVQAMAKYNFTSPSRMPRELCCGVVYN
jgi:hypothetical protein